MPARAGTEPWTARSRQDSAPPVSFCETHLVKAVQRPRHFIETWQALKPLLLLTSRRRAKPFSRVQEKPNRAAPFQPSNEPERARGQHRQPGLQAVVLPPRQCRGHRTPHPAMAEGAPGREQGI